jgi:hypothetical protein
LNDLKNYITQHWFDPIQSFLIPCDALHWVQSYLFEIFLNHRARYQRSILLTARAIHSACGHVMTLIIILAHSISMLFYSWAGKILLCSGFIFWGAEHSLRKNGMRSKEHSISEWKFPTSNASYLEFCGARPKNLWRAHAIMFSSASARILADYWFEI